MPYDYFCPSVNSKVFDRTCSVCGLYFSSQKLLKNHIAVLHSKSETSEMCQRIRPFHVYKYQDGEVLCAISEDDENVEWVDIESIDDDFLDEEATNAQAENENLPLIHDDDLPQWITSPWVNDKQKE